MDHAKNIQPDFLDLRTRAELLDICGDKTGAERLRKLSLDIAREVDLTCYAYQLIWRNKIDDAIEMLEVNAAAHPDSWNVRHSLGEAFETLGDFYSAAMNYRAAASLVDDDDTLTRINSELQRVERMDQAAS
jgi:Flp pilus assembly protein TadD